MLGDGLEERGPVAIIALVLLLSWWFSDPTPSLADDTHHVLTLHALIALVVIMLWPLAWIRWRWFGDARCAYLGMVALSLAFGCLLITFGHDIAPLWDESLTRAGVAGTAAAAVAGLVASARSTEVDARLRFVPSAALFLAALAAAIIVAFPLTAAFETDTIVVAAGVVLVLVGGVVAWKRRRGQLLPWAAAATVAIGAGHLAHALPASHEQTDLLLIELAALAACVIGALRVLRRTYQAAEARAAAARVGRDLAQEERQLLVDHARERAHELRNAVLAIDGATSVALRGRSGDAGQDELRTALSGEFERVRQLLDSDLEGVALTGRFDVSAIVSQQVSLARAIGWDVRWSRPSHAVVAAGVAGEAAEIVQNLLRNAHIHGGTAIEVDVDELSGWVDVTVADRGPGVSAAVRGRLLEGQVPSTRGNGVGLHICARLAQARGADLALTDRPGGGTIARFTLPVLIDDTTSVHDRAARSA